MDAYDAKQLAELLRAAIAQNPGVVSVTLDGQSVSFRPDQAMELLRRFEAEAARQSGKRPVAASIKLSHW